MARMEGLRRILLPPRDAEFFALFAKMADTLVAGSAAVHELLAAEDQARIHRLGERVKQLENECDGILRQTVSLLEVAQQPPFDRDEIANLIKMLDNIMDWMERFANRFVLYRASIDEAGVEQLLELSGIVDSACKEVQAAVQCLHKRRREVDVHCVALHELESQADEIHHAALARGFDEVEARFTTASRLVGELAGPTGTPAASTAGARPDGAGGIALILQEIHGVQHAMFRFANLRELLKALERASDAGDAVATILKRMVISNV
jgi:uncharacterized protein Yka (UPF0111/DUF47 family)